MIRWKQGMKIFVDTNIFLRFIDGEKTCVSFLNYVKNGSKIFYVQSVVVSELVWVLRTSYEWSVSDVVEILESFLKTTNLKFITKCNIGKAIKLYREINVKYNDCLIVTSMETGNQIVSFDREFDRFEGIKRIEPKDLIG